MKTTMLHHANTSSSPGAAATCCQLGYIRTAGSNNNSQQTTTTTTTTTKARDRYSCSTDMSATQRHASINSSVLPGSSILPAACHLHADSRIDHAPLAYPLSILQLLTVRWSAYG